MNWVKNLDKSVLEYVQNLQDKDNLHIYSPNLSNVGDSKKNIELGFSCYALKIYKLMDRIDNFSEKELDIWADYINSFQQDNIKYPKHSYVDQVYIDKFREQNKENKIKSKLKTTSNFFLNTNYKNNIIKEAEYIRAETKQSISTLYEIGRTNTKKFSAFPKGEKQINKFLRDLNWNFPWTSGAQLAALSVFSKTQLSEHEFKESKIFILEFIENLINKENGLYYNSANNLSNSEKINGAMKIITALDWLDEKIHYPKQLIETCLSINPNSEGCDIVDMVYILYKCSDVTEYRKNDVARYLLALLDIIRIHYKKDEGGFSYFKNNSQTHYYNVRFSKGENSSDLHGTLLMFWAVTMILRVLEESFFDFKALKP